MLKNSFIIFLCFFITSCGYEAMHSKKNRINYDFSISKLNFEGDRVVNLKMKERLNNYILNKKDKDYILKITSDIAKITLAKNLAGDPTKFKIKVSVNILVLNNAKVANNLIFVESFNYDNIADKFDLKRYERELKNNLAETITQKLVFELSKTK